MRDDAIVFEPPAAGPAPGTGASRTWAVGALVRAMADALEARFNPVTVKGEVTGFSRAASGHCYFSLKDEAGQIRCAMFRRAAGLMDFSPKEGDLVQLRGRVAVYEPRGDLQLIVESLERAGQGIWFEQFLKLKAKLESEGLFDAARKRTVPIAPRGIGLVTSTGAAALHDVASALRRRVPHIPVWLAPASVQGANSPGELLDALSKLYQTIESTRRLGSDAASSLPHIDVILLVRGGGSIEDLAAFNNEALARTIAASPVPIISGVGHETDFTIGDFVADLRAPTPTAAAELCATERAAWVGAARLMQERLQEAAQHALDRQAQRLDSAAQRLARPSEALAQERLQLQRLQLQLQHQTLSKYEHSAQTIRRLEADFRQKMQQKMAQHKHRLHLAAQSLELLSPQRTLERGYAVLRDVHGTIIDRKAQAVAGQSLQALVSDGDIQLAVQ